MLVQSFANLIHLAETMTNSIGKKNWWLNFATWNNWRKFIPGKNSRYTVHCISMVCERDTDVFFAGYHRLGSDCVKTLCFRVLKANYVFNNCYCIRV